MECTKLVGELVRARDIIHLEHLYAKKWGSHIILDALYDQVLEGADMIAELVLSRGDHRFKIDSVPESTDIVKYLEKELVPLLDESKDTADEKGFNDISATIDEVKRDVQSALYKLKNLAKKGSNKKDGNDEEHVEYKRQGGVLYPGAVREYSKKSKITRR